MRGSDLRDAQGRFDWSRRLLHPIRSFELLHFAIAPARENRPPLHSRVVTAIVTNESRLEARLCVVFGISSRIVMNGRNVQMLPDGKRCESDKIGIKAWAIADNPAVDSRVHLTRFILNRPVRRVKAPSSQSNDTGQGRYVMSSK
jgi:hypothetical protein